MLITKAAAKQTYLFTKIYKPYSNGMNKVCSFL